VLDDVWNARTEDYHYPMHCHAEPSQTAAGGLYPGGLVADWVLAGPASPKHPRFVSQAEFASNQPHEGSPVTEFRKRPDRAFLRKFYNRRLRFPDGAEFEMWSFEDETSGRRFPAPLIRIDEGKVAHVTLEPSKRVHTIHLHGQEPDPRNDGVGHTSFEVSGSYTYQWQPQKGLPGDPNKGNAGTYFYHCHVNTVLHVQMGMLGPLIVDPVVHPAYPVSAGARRPFVDGPEYDIATEALLVPFAVDPRWHELNHAAGLSGEDVGLNRFQPRNFYVLGGALAGPGSPGAVQYPKELVVNGPGMRIPTLLRVLNANYFPTQLTFLDPGGQPVRLGELIAHDGRPFRDTSNPDPSAPCLPVHDAVGVDASSPLLTDVLAFGAAERYDLVLRPPSTGTFTARFQWFHWVTGKEIAVRTVPLVVR
jgi:FtsP/CotA-like multicopper oxidase with cupredoxin domain